MGKYSIVLDIQKCALSLNRIGEGAFAQVYELNTKWNQRYALKSFEKHSFYTDPKARKAFYNEI